MSKSGLAIGAMLLLLGSAAMAEDRTTVAECAGDIKALCAGVQPGEGRIRTCIKSHLKELSGPCQAVVLKAAAIREACGADIEKLCAGVKPGGPGEGRIATCLKPHMDEISEPCKEALSKETAGKN